MNDTNWHYICEYALRYRTGSYIVIITKHSGVYASFEKLIVLFGDADSHAPDLQIIINMEMRALSLLNSTNGSLSVHARTSATVL